MSAPVRGLLGDGLANVEAAGVELEQLARDDRGEPALAESLAWHRARSFEIGRDLRRELALSRTSGHLRGELLLVAQSVEALTEAIGEAAEHLALFSDSLETQEVRILTGVVRDLARGVAQLGGALEGPSDERAELAHRALDRQTEARAAFRRARRLGHGAETGGALAAMRRELLLRRLNSSLQAGTRALRRVEQLGAALS